MKKILNITLSLFALNAFGSVCEYKDINSTGATYVVPVYKATANYFFDKTAKSAYALINWEFDTETTRDCFIKAKEQDTNKKFVIPTVRVSTVNIKVMGGNIEQKVDVFPMANGHWNSSTAMISLPFSAKNKIETAIKNNEPLIEVRSDIKFRATETIRSTLAKISCAQKTEELGLLNLFKRLKFVKEKAESMPESAGVSTEEALGEFLSTCVEFSNVEAESLGEFERKQKISSKINSGEFDLIGNKTRDIAVDMPSILQQITTVQDI